MRVMVIGDIMIDRYTYVKSSRKANEANMPIWDEVDQISRPGGAANVARNLKAIGGEDVDVYLCGIMGDLPGNHYAMLKQSGLNTDFVMGGCTMVKHRYVETDTKQYLFRHDNFRKFPDEDVEWFETMVGGHTLYTQFDAVIISDYDKGTITPDIAQMLKSFPLTVVDSKREDIRIFDGMNILHVNEQEYSNQVSSKLYPNFTKFFEYCIVTKGEKGADLLQCEQIKSSDKRYIVHTENFPTEPKNVTDVTGCGDTFTAAVTYETVKSRDIRRAIRLGNLCAGKVVEKFGTETV